MRGILRALIGRGGAREKDRAGAPLLVHVHIPKCAGSTFKRILMRSFGDRHLNVYSKDPYYVLEPDEIVETLRANPDAVSIGSHSIRTFPPRLGERLPLYVTFLREPLAQFLSYITYIKKDFAELSQTHRQYVPERCAQMSIRDVAEWLVTNEEPVPFRSNYTVNYFAEFAPGKCEAPVETAMRVLDGFCFVGLVEEMEQNVPLVSEKLESYGLALNCDDFQRVNVSGHLLDDVEWLNERDRVGRLVLESIEQDALLYRRFKEQRATERAERS